MRLVNVVVSKSVRGLRTAVQLGISGDSQIEMSWDDYE